MSVQVTKVVTIIHTCPREGCPNHDKPVKEEVVNKSHVYGHEGATRICLLHNPPFQMSKKYVYGEVDKDLINAER